jgi:hypothetical protein
LHEFDKRSPNSDLRNVSEEVEQALTRLREWEKQGYTGYASRLDQVPSHWRHDVSVDRGDLYGRRHLDSGLQVEKNFFSGNITSLIPIPSNERVIGKQPERTTEEARREILKLEDSILQLRRVEKALKEELQQTKDALKGEKKELIEAAKKQLHLF